jgi:SAM-dependent methyltransferase
VEAEQWNRLASSYDEEVVSPLHKDVRNPLFEKLEQVPTQSVLGDLGCGRGDLVPVLTERFRRSYFIDFSTKMIEQARARTTKRNASFHIADLRDLRHFRKKFDVAIAVNSVIMPRVPDVKKALSEIHLSLKEKGVFYGVFPAMGSVLYQAFLIHEQELEACDDEKDALRNTRRKLERGKYNFVTGHYHDDVDRQKFYYDFELRRRMAEAGFRNVALSKVRYPWEVELSDFEQFPGKPEMWDWFISAEK